MITERVAIVHDWLTGMRGGERVLASVSKLFPRADIFTLFHLPGQVSKEIENHRIITSRLQVMPWLNRHYRQYLPLFPLAIEQFDLTDYTLVLSLSHCVAMGAITRPECCHICYCFTPVRYIWDQYWQYFGGLRPGLKKMTVAWFAHNLRQWDVAASRRVDYYLTTSDHVAKRIWKYYRRPSVVMPPGVDTDYFQPAPGVGDFFLIVSALSPYKRLDLAIEACNRRNAQLVIIGWGPEEKRLRRLAGPTIRFLGAQPDSVLRQHYQHCRALIFPGEEDFGLTPLEAQASGRPVLAYARGGALETIIDGVTGLFFQEPTVESLCGMLEDFDGSRFDSQIIRNQALRFTNVAFERALYQKIGLLAEDHKRQLSECCKEYPR